MTFLRAKINSIACSFNLLILFGQQSEQQAWEAKKLADQEIKRHKMKEKQSAEENGRATVVAKKMQEESTTRMSKHSLPIGLPKTLSMRDDPLTKANAFLTEMPTIE